MFLDPKSQAFLKTSKVFDMKLHSKVSNAFSKSTNRSIPWDFLLSKKSIMSLSSLIFWPLYLPLTNPV